jgi:hypothetical protein
VSFFGLFLICESDQFLQFKLTVVHGASGVGCMENIGNVVFKLL